MAMDRERPRGRKRRTAEVIADNVYFGDSRRDAEAGGYAPPPPAGGSYSGGGYSAPAAPGAYSAPAAPGGYSAPAGGSDQFAELADDDDGDLPF